MANCPNTDSTKKETSVISYNGTPLPCTDVKTCDDINTILNKFNNIICSVTDSVNTLTEEITNITEDLMIITEDVENINDQIFICCPICDFTITATELPVCDFTATATELPTCNFTGSVNQLPDPTTTTTSSSSTSTSTSTTTSTSSSTTTTTTTSQLLLCFQAEVYPPIFNPGTFHTVQYLDCYGNPQIVNVPDGGTMVTICYTGIVSDNNNGLTNPLFTYCLAPTTTTTTTT